MQDREEKAWLRLGDEEGTRRYLEQAVERRKFLERAGKLAGGLLLAGALGSLASCAAKDTAGTAPASTPKVTSAPASAPSGAGADLGIASGGGDPGVLARKAVDALGGMGRFVKAGDVVVIKPNASFMDGPEGGTSTHPAVVAQVVAMCSEAGAARVIVTDHTLRGSAETCMSRNGIGPAARSAGAEVIAYGGSDSASGVSVDIPSGVILKNALVYPTVLDADVVITVPKAKSHSGAGLSLGMKNLIGVTANMSNIHNGDLHQGIADLTSLIRPSLSVIDASIVLTANGPGGPGPVSSPGIVAASPDPVAADSFACTIFGMSAADVPYIVNAGRAGLGQVDFNRLKIARV